MDSRIRIGRGVIREHDKSGKDVLSQWGIVMKNKKKAVGSVEAISWFQLHGCVAAFGGSWQPRGRSREGRMASFI